MILVTGANGFVGQALVADLSARNLPFRAASRGDGPGLFAVGDITPATDWSAALVGVSSVIHLAARVHVMTDLASDPLDAYRFSNVDATNNLARQAMTAGVRRFVFVSSIKVNGEATLPGAPFTEADQPAPVDPYGQSKLEAERALFDLGRQSGMEVVVVRPPLVYGPGVRANFAALMQWVERGLPLPLGAIANRRSMIFVKNLTDLLILCTSHPAAAGEVFLVSDGEDLSTTQLLESMAAALGRPSRLIKLSPSTLALAAKLSGRTAVAQRLLESLQVSIAKTSARLDWKPPYALAEGLKATAAARTAP
jgi:UDP-glucose 4-epimerase